MFRKIVLLNDFPEEKVPLRSRLARAKRAREKSLKVYPNKDGARQKSPRFANRYFDIYPDIGGAKNKRPKGLTVKAYRHGGRWCGEFRGAE